MLEREAKICAAGETFSTEWSSHYENDYKNVYQGIASKIFYRKNRYKTPKLFSKIETYWSKPGK
jgi:hypothetical protein